MTIASGSCCNKNNNADIKNEILNCSSIDFTALWGTVALFIFFLAQDIPQYPVVPSLQTLT
jgi:hypothetical protein